MMYIGQLWIQNVVHFCTRWTSIDWFSWRRRVLNRLMVETFDAIIPIKTHWLFLSFLIKDGLNLEICFETESAVSHLIFISLLSSHNLTFLIIFLTVWHKKLLLMSYSVIFLIVLHTQNVVFVHHVHMCKLLNSTHGIRHVVRKLKI